MMPPFIDAPLAYALLVTISAASLYGLLMDSAFILSGLFDLNAVRRGRQYYRMITSAFLHGSVGHLLVNMITFFFFGPVTEYVFGTERFFLIFFGSQLGAMAFTMYRKKDQEGYQALGASGAIAGVLTAFCVVRPFVTIYLFGIIPMPAIALAVMFIAYSTFAMRGVGMISHEAHLGGAITGGVIGLLMAL